jgi:hypothetical protein
VPFFYRAGSEFEELYVGVGSRRMRALFQVCAWGWVGGGPELLTQSRLELFASTHNAEGVWHCCESALPGSCEQC